MSKSTTKKQTFTFISRAAPYGNNRAQLCLDAAFAAAVFEQQVNYLFLDDGVYQLLADQNAEDINSKTLGRALETLDLYGIENVYVLDSALQERNLHLTDLLTAARVVSAERAAALIANSDQIINL